VSRKNRYLGVISVTNKSVRDSEISDQSVFRGQYLPLSLSKRGVPYIKKRKKKASAKKEPRKTKNIKKSEVPASFVSFVL
jgi:hypothetical protein